MDNRIFRVNGEGDDLLFSALDLVFKQNWLSHCESWEQTESNGLILCWAIDLKCCNNFPSKLNAADCLPIVSSWLNSDFAKTVQLGEMCNDADHDGDNKLGWEVYCDDWGHVGDNHYAICAIRPAYMWFGK